MKNKKDKKNYTVKKWLSAGILSFSVVGFTNASLMSSNHFAYANVVSSMKVSKHHSKKSPKFNKGYRNKFFIRQGATYYADNNGKLVHGLQTINNRRYYFKKNGKQVKGKIIKVNGNNMYFDSRRGILVTNQYLTIQRQHYYADLNGILTRDHTHTNEALMTNNTFNQNFHYNAPRGYSNDIQSIVPHKDVNGKVDYYDVYYLYNPNPAQIPTNEWYHVTTKDFKTFMPYDTSNSTSINNVAIPTSQLKNSKGQSTEVVKGSHANWKYVATGSIIDNNGRLTKDQWGNKIDSDAKIAYFTEVTNKQVIYLAYSNKGQQFRPYQQKPVLTADMYKISTPRGDFRDIVVQNNPNNSKQLVAYVAGGWERKFYVFTSTDGVQWKHNSNNDINMGLLVNHPMEVETPIVKNVNGQAFLFYSWHNDNNRISAAVNGTINSQGIFHLTSDSKIQTLDGDSYKGDTYAGNYTNLNNQTLINVNWSGDWAYSPIGTSAYDNISKHSGSITLPRMIQNNNGQLEYIPIEPNSKLVNSYRLSNSSQGILTPTDNKLDFTFDNSSNRKTITLKRVESKIIITLDNRGITVKRISSLNPKLDKEVTTPLSSTNISKLELYVDNTSIEAYLPEITKTYNIVNFGSKENEPYVMTVNGDSRIDNYQFGGVSDSDINATLINDIGKLQSNLNSDLSLLQQTKTLGNIDVINATMDNINRANIQVKLANHYVQLSTGQGNDVSSNMNMILAKNSYDKAKDIENNVAATIMKISNDNNLDSKLDVSNGDVVINGHHTFFANGKRQAGTIIDGHYYDAQTGYMVVNTFYLDREGHYYYFDNNGDMVKNHVIKGPDNAEYYFDNNGIALSGSHTIDNNNYYFDPVSHVMIHNDIIKNDNKTLSYYDGTGKLATSTIKINGNIYNVKNNGEIQGNNIFIKSPSNPGKVYYLKHNKVTTGYINYDGNYYLLNNGSLMMNGIIKSANGRIKYDISNNGKMIKNQFVQGDNSDTYYYFGKDGKALIGDHVVKGHHLYFDSKGVQVKGRFVKRKNGRLSYFDTANGDLVTTKTMIDGRLYTFSKWGNLIAPQKIVGSSSTGKYYLNAKNRIKTGKHVLNGETYVFDKNGKMITTGYVTVNGQKLPVNADGTVETLTTYQKILKQLSQIQQVIKKENNRLRLLKKSLKHHHTIKLLKQKNKLLKSLKLNHDNYHKLVIKKNKIQNK